VEKVAVVVVHHLVQHAGLHAVIAIDRPKVLPVPVVVHLTVIVVVHGVVVAVKLVVTPLVVNNIDAPVRARLVWVVVVVAHVLLPTVCRVDPVTEVALHPVATTPLVVDAVVGKDVVLAEPIA